MNRTDYLERLLASARAYLDEEDPEFQPLIEAINRELPPDAPRWALDPRAASWDR